MKATAQAHPNIALIKYWGKRDQALFLPHTPSLSMTLSGLTAVTTVQFSGDLKADAVELDGRPVEGAGLERFTRHLDLIRELAGFSCRARVSSANDFPTAAGLASSAAGGAALTAALCWAAGLDPSPHELSALARRFSGSACRSVEGGFCQWNRGVRDDGADSFAVQAAPPSHWPQLRMVVTVVSGAQKAVSSRAGMQHSVETSPFFEGWVRQVDVDLAAARQALERRDLEALGRTAEANACRMHAVALGADPPTLYMKPVTLDVIARVWELRAGGVQAYFTLDAGPNPVVLCLDADAPRVADALLSVPGVQRTVTAAPGEGVSRSETPLF